MNKSFVDAPFCPDYYGSSAPKKKKTYCGKEKSGSRQQTNVEEKNLIIIKNKV